MCMCLPLDEEKPVFHVHTSSGKPQQVLRVLARVMLDQHAIRKEAAKNKIVSLDEARKKKAS